MLIESILIVTAGIEFKNFLNKNLSIKDFFFIGYVCFLTAYLLDHFLASHYLGPLSSFMDHLDNWLGN